MALDVSVAAHYRAAVDQILASRLFLDAPVQRKLLAYLAEKSLAGAAGDLKEYAIGTELFGKPDSYSPQSDPSVRVQASRLRAKLDEYYRGEGHLSDVVIRLPKGSFTLLFEPRAHEQPESPPFAGGVAPAALIDTEPRRTTPLPVRTPFRWPAWWWAAASVVLLCAVAVREFVIIRDLQNQVRQKSIDPAVNALWQPLLSSPRPLLLVIGTPLFVGLAGGCYRTSTVNSPADVQNSAVLRDLFLKTGQSSNGTCSSYTGVGESVGMFLLGQVFFEAGKKVSIQRSGFLGWDAIESHDLVVLGSTKSNPQMKEIPVKTKYKLENGAIQVSNPSAVEPTAYRSIVDQNGEVLSDYTLISRLPGLDVSSFIVLVGSESTAGNWAGVQYMTTPSYAKELVGRLTDSSGHIPNYFEVVVKSDFKSGHPVKIEYVRHHIVTAR